MASAKKRPAKRSSNPAPASKKPAAAKMIYGQVLRIWMRRTNRHECSEKCKRLNHVYEHVFTGKLPQIWGVGRGKKKALVISQGAI